MALPIDKELILEKHCPSMSLLYLDDNGRAFRKRILAAMEEHGEQLLHKERNEIQTKITAIEIGWAQRAHKAYTALQIISELKSFTDKEGFVKQLCDEVLVEWKGAEKEVEG